MRLSSRLFAAACIAAALGTAARAAGPQQAAPRQESDKPPETPWLRTVPLQAQLTEPSTICGLTVVRGDSSIDPEILKPVPETGVTYTMRVIEPAMCRPEGARESLPQPTSSYYPLRRRTN